MRLEGHSLVAWCVALVDKNVIPINSGKLKLIVATVTLA